MASGGELAASEVMNSADLLYEELYRCQVVKDRRNRKPLLSAHKKRRHLMKMSPNRRFQASWDKRAPTGLHSATACGCSNFAAAAGIVAIAAGVAAALLLAAAKLAEQTL